MLSRRVIREFDYFLFGAALLLAVMGLVAVFPNLSGSAPSSIFLRQLAWVGLGILICFVVVSLDYHFLTDHAFFLYVGGLALLAGVLYFGVEIKGTRSWLGVWGLGFQPSEPMKIAVILALTRYLAELHEDYLRARDVIILGAITLLPVTLVILQGDLGTAVMYAPIVLGIASVAGMRIRFFVGLLVALLCLAPAGWLFLEDYQKQRILVTFDPQLDPQGYGYQTRQSQIAVGSGGFLGKGLGQGLQGKLGFVPEVHTDFIFAELAEEVGFLGASLILLLFLLVLMRMILIGESARDRAGTFIVTGIVSLLFFHVLVNIGMSLGLLPAIGIPLPLLSYGGSVTVTTFIALGLVLNVHCRRFIY